MIAALFVEEGGVYYGLADVDPWPETRDARLYYGPHPVVAHPPCARWCRLAGLVEGRWGHKRGEDGGCFASALESVRKWGGVLEHPAYTDAWASFRLVHPRHGRWVRDHRGGWVAQVYQSAYGHRAAKATWLYANVSHPPELDWSSPDGSAWISWLGNHTRGKVVERMGKRERNATPTAFRDVLLDIARRAA